MVRVDNLSKNSEICDLLGSADSCDVQEAARDVARDRPCEKEGLEMGRVGPPVHVEVKISSITWNLSESEDTPAGGGVRNEESI